MYAHSGSNPTQSFNDFFFFQGTDILSRKKIVRKSPHSTARFIALSPHPIPSLAVLHTEKQAFSVPVYYDCLEYQNTQIVPP